MQFNIRSTSTEILGACSTSVTKRKLLPVLAHYFHDPNKAAEFLIISQWLFWQWNSRPKKPFKRDKRAWRGPCTSTFVRAHADIPNHPYTAKTNFTILAGLFLITRAVLWNGGFKTRFSSQKKPSQMAKIIIRSYSDRGNWPITNCDNYRQINVFRPQSRLRKSKGHYSLLKKGNSSHRTKSGVAFFTTIFLMVQSFITSWGLI